MTTDPLDDLADARAKIEATREALQAALNGQEAPDAVRQAIERLERIAAEVKRLEGITVGETMPVDQRLAWTK
jgi:hypothetical protein